LFKDEAYSETIEEYYNINQDKEVLPEINFGKLEELKMDAEDKLHKVVNDVLK
jgi:hypothetical protein